MTAPDPDRAARTEPAAAPALAAREPAMRVRFWGVRGSIPTPGPTTVRYGGNTSCVSVGFAGGQVLVLDAGTGIRTLGDALVGGDAEISIALTHAHWDHIQGFPFFAPLFEPGPPHLLRPARAGQSALQSPRRADGRGPLPHPRRRAALAARDHVAARVRPPPRRRGRRRAAPREPPRRRRRHPRALPGARRRLRPGQRARSALRTRCHLRRDRRLLPPRRRAHPRRAVRGGGLPRQEGVGAQRRGAGCASWQRRRRPPTSSSSTTTPPAPTTRSTPCNAWRGSICASSVPPRDALPLTRGSRWSCLPRPARRPYQRCHARPALRNSAGRAGHLVYVTPRAAPLPGHARRPMPPVPRGVRGGGKC